MRSAQGDDNNRVQCADDVHRHQHVVPSDQKPVGDKAVHIL